MDLTKIEYKNYLETLEQPNMAEIKNRIGQSISDTDIFNYFGHNGKEDTITYAELEQFNNLEQVLEKNKSFKIILIEEQENTGHWVLILRYGKTIEFFNSYGTSPSYEIDLIDDKQNEQLGQDEKYLNKLLNLAMKKYKVIYNKKRFQKLENGVNTCGRHVLLRIIMLQHYNMNLERYIKFMEHLATKYKMDYDEVVSMIII